MSRWRTKVAETPYSEISQVWHIEHAGNFPLHKDWGKIGDDCGSVVPLTSIIGMQFKHVSLKFRSQFTVSRSFKNDFHLPVKPLPCFVRKRHRPVFIARAIPKFMADVQ